MRIGVTKIMTLFVLKKVLKSIVIRIPIVTFSVCTYVLFSFINIGEISEINLDRIVRISEWTFDNSFTLDKEYIQFESDNQTYLTYRIIGLNKNTYDPYDYFSFDSLAHKAFIL